MRSLCEHPSNFVSIGKLHMITWVPKFEFTHVFGIYRCEQSWVESGLVLMRVKPGLHVVCAV